MVAREGPFVCGPEAAGSNGFRDVQSTRNVSLNPEDVSRSIWRLGKLPSEDAISLVRDVMEIIEEKAKARHLSTRKKLRTRTRAPSAPAGASEPTATAGARRVRRPRAKRAAAAAALAAQEEPLA